MVREKYSGRAMADFLVWMLVSGLAALVIAYLLVQFKPAILHVIENEDAVVGLISFVFTLPITLAAAIVVVRLGDGMDRLTHQGEVRESFALAKEMYDDLFEQLKGIANVLNESKENIYWMLHKIQAERFIFSRLSEEEQEDIKSGRRKTEHALDSNGNPLPLDYDDVDEVYAKKLISEVSQVRDGITSAIGDFIQHCWSVEQKKQPHRFLGAIAKHRAEVETPLPSLEELYESNPQMDKAWLKGMHDNLRSTAENDKSIYARLESSVNDVVPVYDNPLITALVQIRIANYFCDNGNPDEQVVRQIIKDMISGDTSFQEATDLLLGLTIFPLPIVKLDRNSTEINGVIYDSYGNNAAEIRNNLAREVNHLGLLAINDLRDVWPTRDELINHILGMVAPEASSTKEVRDEIIKRMKALPDPEKLVAIFMSGNNRVG